MCPTSNINDGCLKTACDATCRKELACRLKNSSQLDVINCKNEGLLDVEYGFEYLISSM